jgi:U5 small nuclear ribonucleoprotein component
MASFTDYDEFGNYIGGDLDSDEDEEMDAQPAYPEQHAQPLEGFDEEGEENVPMNEGALMHIGKGFFFCEITSRELLTRTT